MEKLNNSSDFSLIFKYALKDLSRNYHKIFSIIVTLFISLFILSAIFTIEDSLKKELNDNAKALLGGDLEIDYNRNQGNLDLVNKVKEFAAVSQMIEFSTMLSTTGREKINHYLLELKLWMKIILYMEMLFMSQSVPMKECKKNLILSLSMKVYQKPLI